MRKIRRAAVIGSGVMGGGIAALLAGAGVETILLDIVPPDLKDDQKKGSQVPQSDCQIRARQCP
jgi:3-hydroxyacyl-CoA dehydrogenase